jgi:hypothetical protein
MSATSPTSSPKKPRKAHTHVGWASAHHSSLPTKKEVFFFEKRTKKLLLFGSAQGEARVRQAARCSS